MGRVVSDESADLVVDGFEWDFDEGGNVDHLAQHGVMHADVHFVHEHDPLYVRNLPSLTRTATHVMVGRDSQERSLAIFIIETARPGIWYVVTGRRGADAHDLLERHGRI
jgi:hypothetical protein